MLSTDATIAFETARQPELASFLRDKAWLSEQGGFGRTFVLPGHETDDPPLLGYYTIIMSRLTTEHLPAELQQKLGAPPATVPAAYLTNVARDDRVAKSRAIGALLVGNALRRVVSVAEQIGCTGVMLYAMNPSLEAYYGENFGFIKLNLKPSKTNTSQLMFLPLIDILANM